MPTLLKLIGEWLLRFLPMLRRPVTAPEGVEEVVFPGPRIPPRDLEVRLRGEVVKPEYANEKDISGKWKGGFVTHCNAFTRNVCKWYGWSDFEAEDRDQAGEITWYMRTHPASWKPVDMQEAAMLANQGHLVVAGQEHPKPPPTGHVCIVAPGEMIYSNKWSCLVPIAANVGGDNWYGKGLNYAFGKEPPKMFAYTGVRV